MTNFFESSIELRYIEVRLSTDFFNLLAAGETGAFKSV